jgi:hypothetical protein
MNNNLLSQLKDIDGLDAISAWPLAIGWWIIIVLVLAIILAVVFYLVRQRMFKNSWKGSISRTLSEMQNALGNNNTQAIATELSEVLRIIAIKRFSRNECAGLAGKEWLQWLEKNDAASFDWVAHGKLLLEAPYAPSGKTIAKGNVDLLINATKKWVK